MKCTGVIAEKSAVAPAFFYFSDSKNRVAIAAGNVQGIGDFPNERFRIWLAICIARRVCIHGQKKDQFMYDNFKKSNNN